jgi:hypothetical protein
MTMYGPVPPAEKPRKHGLMRVVGAFDTTGKVIAAVTGLVTAIVGVFALVNQLRGDTPTPGPSSSAASNELVVADQVRKCEELHQMSGSQQVDKDPNGLPIAVRSCEWPRTPGADPDGYTVIRVQSVERPGFPESSTASRVDRIHGPCQVFELAYDFGKMGGFDHLPAFSAKVGAVLHGGEGARYEGLARDLPAYPDRDEVDVFLNYSYSLASARCVS